MAQVDRAVGYRSGGLKSFEHALAQVLGQREEEAVVVVLRRALLGRLAPHAVPLQARLGHGLHPRAAPVHTARLVRAWRLRLPFGRTPVGIGLHSVGEGQHVVHDHLAPLCTRVRVPHVHARLVQAERGVRREHVRREQPAYR